MGCRDILGLDPGTGNDRSSIRSGDEHGAPLPQTFPVRSSRRRMKMPEELAEERKRTVEDVRRTLDLTTGQIWAAFAILGEKDVPSEQLAKLKQCGVTR